MQTFEQLGISKLITPSLEKMNFSTPTEIQNATIPFVLEGRDVLASAQTGTGKTGAFAIPLVSMILDSNRQGLILTPTRELASQVMGVIRELIGSNSTIKTAFIIGGEPMGRQLKQLQNNPRIVVGTPGRINDHLKRGTLNISKTDFLVIDETDRMLDMGFSIQIDEIIRHMPAKKQTLMFSATLGREIIGLAKKYLNNPERVCFDSTVSDKPDIDQEIIKTAEEDKYGELKKILDSRIGSVIVFVNTKHGADKLAKRISFEGHTAKAIHGDLRQERREQVVKGFRKQSYRVMVATDVASRGLDIPHIEHVVNYDLPQCSDDYIHRIGRTGRAGSKGSSVCFITPKEHKKSFSIRKIIDPSIKDSGPSNPNDRGPAGRRNPGSRRPGESSASGFQKKRFEGAGSGRSSDRSFDRPRRQEGEASSFPGYTKKRFEGGSADRSSERSFDKPRRPEGETSSFPRKRFEGGSAGRSSERSFDRPRRPEGESSSFPRKRFEGGSAGRSSERSFDRPRRPEGETSSFPKKRFEGGSAGRSSERSFDKPRRPEGETSSFPRKRFEGGSAGRSSERSFDRPRRPEGETSSFPRKRFEGGSAGRSSERSFDRPRRPEGEASASRGFPKRTTFDSPKQQREVRSNKPSEGRKYSDREMEYLTISKKLGK